MGAMAADPQTPGPGATSSAEVWIRRIALIIVAVVIAVIVWGMFAAAVPRLWSQRIADQVDGRMSAGIFWGLFYGFVCSFIPVLIAWQARRPLFKKWWKVVVVAVALLAAAPNLLTLGISLGDNSASDAGWLALTTRAPGFQWATLFGAIMGVLLAVFLIVLVASSKRRKAQVGSLKGELAERDEREKAAEATQKREAAQNGEEGRDG